MSKPVALITLLSTNIFLSLSAMAQDVPGGGGTNPEEVGSAFMNFFPLIMVVVLFYFLIIRPQGKKMKEHQQLIDSIKKGDKIITAGGIEATISKVEEGTGMVEAEISPGVKVKVVKRTITELPGRTPEKPAKKQITKK